jgi:hypothetical protein
MVHRRPADQRGAAELHRAFPSHSAKLVTGPGRWWLRKGDAGLSALLAAQGLTLFVAIPLGTVHPAAHVLLDACHLAFAAICVAVLTRHRAAQGALLTGLAVLAVGPVLGDRLSERLGLDTVGLHAMVAFTAFGFNGLVTALVARHVFGPGRITVHRVQGAVLLYLNVAALFAITYGALETYAPGAIVPNAGHVLSTAPGERIAALTYFSLATITTTGYGDLAPVHPLARSLANLESVFGQLFPATLLARLVALQLAHGRGVAFASSAHDEKEPEGDGRA